MYLYYSITPKQAELTKSILDEPDKLLITKWMQSLTKVMQMQEGRDFVISQEAFFVQDEVGTHHKHIIKLVRPPRFCLF